MSLLLDALKKAAADKEKSGNKEDENHAAEVETTSMSEDELPSIDDEIYQAPEIDEELIASDSTDSPEDKSTEEHTEASIEDLDLELDDDFDLAEKNAVDLEENAETTAEEPDGKTEADIENNIEPATADEPVSDVHVSAEEKYIEKIQAEKVQAEKVADQAAINETGFVPLPEYNSNDARKILEVSQKRYRNKQRVMYYGMYVFAALLFFVGSYLYYTTEALDNSKQPRFKPNFNPTTVTSPKKTEQTASVKTQVVTAKTTIPIEKNTQLVVNKKAPVATRKAATPAKTITIVKQNKPDPLSVLLQRAYKAYQSAQYQDADNLYQQVLRRDARQRDALLGKAAIAIVNDQYAQAKSYYQQVLYLYPKDSIAKSALVDLLKKQLSVANESQLNVLLRENPQAAHVHFSLGLLYARQERLKQSQQAFFDAYSIEKKADYAYNLAVMLDKLSQSKAALTYYKKASELADQEVNHFSEKSVLDRIEQLEAEHE